MAILLLSQKLPGPGWHASKFWLTEAIFKEKCAPTKSKIMLIAPKMKTWVHFLQPLEIGFAVETKFNQDGEPFASENSSLWFNFEKKKNERLRGTRQELCALKVRQFFSKISFALGLLNRVTRVQITRV